VHPARNPRYLAWIRTLPALFVERPRVSKPLIPDRAACRRNHPTSARFRSARAITGPAETRTISWALARLSDIIDWISGPWWRDSTPRHSFGLNLAHLSRITWATNTCSVQSVLGSIQQFARPSLSNARIDPGNL